MKWGKQSKKRYSLFFICTAAVLLVVYLTCFFQLYQWINGRLMMEAYNDVCALDLEDLQELEEASDVLDDYEVKQIEFVITDDAFQTVYMTRKQSDASRHFIERNAFLFEEKPKLEKRKREHPRSIIVWGKIQQGGREYYIHIRKEVRSAKEMADFSSAYFLISLVILCAMNMFFFKKQESEVRDTKRFVEDSQNARSEFVTNVSHELKTPLAIISEQMEMLRLETSSVDREYYYASIQEEIEKMSGLIGDMLNLTNMEQAMKDMILTEVNLTDLVEHVILKHSAMMERKQLQVETDILPKCTVSGNRRFLEIALNNYMMNALEHVEKEGLLKISLTAKGRDVRIGVYNDGARVDDAIGKQIWDYNVSVSSQTDESAERHNAGIGLYSVKKIVKQHQGIYGYTNKEHGVEFWMQFPTS